MSNINMGNQSNVVPTSSTGGKKLTGILDGLFSTKRGIGMMQVEHQLRRETDAHSAGLQQQTNAHRILHETAGRMTTDENLADLTIKTHQRARRFNTSQDISDAKRYRNAKDKDGTLLFPNHQQVPGSVAATNAKGQINLQKQSTVINEGGKQRTSTGTAPDLIPTSSEANKSNVTPPAGSKKSTRADFPPVTAKPRTDKRIGTKAMKTLAENIRNAGSTQGTL